MIRKIIHEHKEEININDKEVRVLLKPKYEKHDVIFKINKSKVSIFCVVECSNEKGKEISLEILPLANKKRKLEWLIINFVLFIEDEKEKEININLDLSKIRNHEIYLRKILFRKNKELKIKINEKINNPNNVMFIKQESSPLLSKEDYKMVKEGYLKEILNK